MAKCYVIIAVISITLALVSAEPPRFRLLKLLANLRTQSNRKLSARQEQAPDVAAPATPYPPSGVTPEIAFDLPTETEAPLSEPDLNYGPPESNPNETYLPPEQTPDKTYGPPEHTPDQTYLPPEVENINAIDEPNNTYIPPATAIEEPKTEELPPPANNLIQPKKVSKPHSISLHSQRSRSASLRIRSAPVQQIFNTEELVHL